MKEGWSGIRIMGQGEAKKKREEDKK